MKVSAQTIDYITTKPAIIQDSTFDANWEHLLPTLKMITNTSTIKKERLLNVVELINYLLSDDIENNECDKKLEKTKQTIELRTPSLQDIESIADERLDTITKKAFDIKNGAPNAINLQNFVPQNKTEDFSKILVKISTALAKLEDQKEKQKIQSSPTVMGMFRTKNTCQNKLNPPLYEALDPSPKPQLNQAGINTVSQATRFTIPCQRASDILKETSSFVVPKAAYCNLPKNTNLNSRSKNPKSNSDNLPFTLVPNYFSCVEEDDSFAVLFRPKKISMMQVYGNLLKKIATTVLVPYHVSKLSL
ncbi:unnamed protein product [Arctia plantaginis]|uniref:Uncharacterized protein n=1 Tax=Arctia plantaginis TaxID=874455 RepID=A0A8S1A671_ARCPL|nr:unnamed protein product [Arctia plantaginis]